MCDACSCSTDTIDITTTQAKEAAMPGATTETFTVTGMTCAHCVGAVSAEVRQLAGVSSVDVDLPTGAVTVTSNEPLDRDAVRSAVEEAGYELANT